jgi:diaminopimelate epimerase
MAASLPLQKWQALGNDYLIVEAASLPWPLTPGRIRRLCEPHLGVGADGILLLSRPPAGAGHVAELRIFNPDGSEAELSGNGAREAALYLRRAGWTDLDEFTMLTAAGFVRPQITGPRTCRMGLGRASLRSPDYPRGGADGTGTVTTAEHEFTFQHVSIGNPQCAIWVGDEAELDALDLPALGPGIERHPAFPQRTNVSWFTARDPHTIRARIFERGVGETLSSGTGASGAAIAWLQRGGRSPVTVKLDGGELTVEVDENLDVNLTGWAVPVFAGELSSELIEELHACPAE